MPERWLDALQRGERWLALSAFLVLVAVIFADVVSREISGSGLYWAARAGVWANVLVVMAGFGLASADGAHLRPRFADTWLPQRWLPLLQTLQHGVMALFCISIASLASWVVLGSWQLGEVSIDVFLPVWPVQIFLPLAFFLAALRHGLYARYPALRPAEQSALALQDSKGRA